MRILVVEDDRAVLQALTMVLEAEGYDVTAARNGEEALQALDGSVPDLVLLDLWMPIMNGWQFLGQLRDLPGPVRDVPVSAVSAEVNAGRDDLPVEIFMTKPLDIEKLHTAVRHNLGQPI